MFCRNAMLTDVVQAGPDWTIRDAVSLLQQQNVRVLPIVDGEGRLLGLFSFDVVLADLLPKALQIEEYELKNVDLRLDYLVDTEADLAKRLRALLPVKLSDVMNPEVRVAHPDTPLVEGIRLLAKHGSPIPVVDGQTRRLLGLLTFQQAMVRLMAFVAEDD
jgi:CBS-domain-containing membrane protein